MLTTAIEMLLQAEDHFSGERRARLNETFNRYVEKLLPESGLRGSLGKTWQLQWVRGEERRPVTLSMLSRGERVQVSLALHLALLEMCERAALPLVVDDLFDDLQSAWRDASVKVLNRFAQRHQVIVTSRDHDIRTRALSSGWHVIDLDHSETAPKPKPETASERSSDDEQQLHLL